MFEYIKNVKERQYDVTSYNVTSNGTITRQGNEDNQMLENL